MCPRTDHCSCWEVTDSSVLSLMKSEEKKKVICLWPQEQFEMPYLIKISQSNKQMLWGLALKSTSFHLIRIIFMPGNSGAITMWKKGPGNSRGLASWKSVWNFVCMWEVQFSWGFHSIVSQLHWKLMLEEFWGIFYWLDGSKSMKMKDSLLGLAVSGHLPPWS